MAVNFGFRCITCGKTLTDYSEDGSSETITSHLADNPTHVIGEQYYDNNEAIIQLNFSCINKLSNKQTYEEVCLYPYLGNKMGTPKKIYIVSKIDNSSFVYDVRLFDMTNNKIIVEKKSLNNTELQIVDLGELTNLPTEEAILELQIKTNSDYAYANIKSFAIKY